MSTIDCFRPLTAFRLTGADRRWPAEGKSQTGYQRVGHGLGLATAHHLAAVRSACCEQRLEHARRQLDVRRKIGGAATAGAQRTFASSSTRKEKSRWKRPLRMLGSGERCHRCHRFRG
jgi:hypothetical protein